jgi:hypothetical protein
MKNMPESLCFYLLSSACSNIRSLANAVALALFLLDAENSIQVLHHRIVYFFSNSD